MGYYQKCFLNSLKERFSDDPSLAFQVGGSVPNVSNNASVDKTRDVESSRSRKKGTLILD